jgi:ribose transport system ATP-binding protein
MNKSLLPILEMRGVYKEFPGVTALGNVDFQAFAGEIHALIGENGAGKSTLMKILAGVHTADEGEILLDGKPVRFRSPTQARAAGMNLIYQELNLAPNLTVAENMFLGSEPRRGLMIDQSRLNHTAADVLERLGASFAPTTRVADLSLAEEQLVEIARAIAFKGRVLVMDEPTSSLSDHETEKLFEVICTLRDEGVAIIYISHRMNEVYSLADRITVLRDGKCIGTLKGDEIRTDLVVHMMAGEREDQLEKHRSRPPNLEPVLELRELTDGHRIQPASFTLRATEVLGLTGLVGSGRSSLARLIYGASRKASGEVIVSGRSRRIASPADAIRAGISYTPENRKEQGLFLEMTSKDNVLMSVFGQYATAGLTNASALGGLYARAAHKLGLDTDRANAQAGVLSGGNQQKLLLARSLTTNPKILILDEPTRGIDMASKREIYAMIAELAASGTAVIVISSELPEILEVSHRVLVMREGAIVAELDPAHGEITQEDILAFATGVRTAPLVGQV